MDEANLVKEETSSQPTAPDIDIDSETELIPQSKTSRRSERPSSTQEDVKTELTNDIAGNSLQTPKRGNGIEKLEISDYTEESKRSTTVVADCEDGENETDSLMKNIQKQRRSTIVGHFNKVAHTVAVKPAPKRQRTGSSTDMDVVMSNDENSPIVKDEDMSEMRPVTRDSPSNRNSFSSKFKPICSRAVGRQTWSSTAADNAVHSERMNTAALLEKYCSVGEGLLVNAASVASNIDVLPDLYFPKEHDYNLINVESLSKDQHVPPKPHPFGQIGDSKFNQKGFISLPWDEQYISKDGILLYAVIERELHQFATYGLASIAEFEILIEQIYSNSDITALANYFKALDSESKKTSVLDLIRRIAQLALRGKELFPGSLPICSTADGFKKECSVTLSQEQCACLLACAFFGIFPENHRRRFNDFNMISLFDNTTELATEKLKFIFSYFSKVLTKMPNGVVSFRRCAISLTESKRLLEEPVNLSEVGIQKEPIEVCHHALQVDFANKYIGGGVLGSGAVQEEIRFLCCPEMIVSLLLCPQMEDNEAVFIVGAQQYSSYTGYAKDLRFKNMEIDVNQEWDKYRRIRCQVVAMDAIQFSRKKDQYSPEKINRELKKAFVGFNSSGSNTLPVATGNWGCGVFNGDIQLKCIIQLIAASAAGRNIVYCPFNEEKTAADFCYLRERLAKNSVSTVKLHKMLCRYEFHYNLSLFDYLLKLVENGE